LQDNCLNRLIFSKEGSSANAFKIQRYDPDSSTNSTFETIIQADEHDNNRYINDDWKTIADEDEIVFNSSVEVDLSKCSSINAIYFKPDGFLYCFDNSVKKLTSEQTIVFRYGSSAVAVDINALGVISSEAIPNEEDENYFGEGADTDTNTDTGTESD
jgi:hypothetical protein